MTQDHPLQTERAAEHVLGQTLAAGDVGGVDLHAEMDAEARMLPACHLRDERLTDLALSGNTRCI